jgi:hypothetical protein
MNTPVTRLVVMAMAAFGVAAACGKSSTPTPTSPSSPTGVATRISISGPTNAAPGETVAYTATAAMSDGSQQDYTRKVSWSSGPSNVVSINRDTGQATGGVAGEAQVSASAPPSSFTSHSLFATLTVLVLPPNTYRLTGKVLESGIAVMDAIVTVTAGTGAGQSAKTSYDGGYRLYGVAGPVEITVSKSGYDTITKAFTVTDSGVLDFPDARQTNGFPVLAGTYTLTITPDANCRPQGNLAPMPPDLLRPRSYPAVMMQNGPEVLVKLSDGAVSPQSDHFLGRIQPSGVDFSIGDGYIGYGPDDGLSVRVSQTNVLSYSGAVHATRSGSTISGWFQGEVDLYELTTFYRLVGGCRMDTHSLTLTAVSTTARGR